MNSQTQTKRLPTVSEPEARVHQIIGLMTEVIQKCTEMEERIDRVLATDAEPPTPVLPGERQGGNQSG